MKKRATLVHLDALVRVTPLAGGYLKAFAQADDSVRDDWDIDLMSAHIATPDANVIADLVERRPDVIGFSTYTWNTRSVKRLLTNLRDVLPDTTRYLVGGAEVIHAGERFVAPDREDILVCNGEGERTFRDALREFAEERPDHERIAGVSFRRDGEFVTTAGHERVRDLSRIPSPFLTGVFSDEELRHYVLFETNRGCPYACEFCFWGGAVGQDIHRQTLDRVKDELTYIAARGARTIYVCDANFGALADDLAIAEHLVELRAASRAPARIIYSYAKNRPDRLVSIASTLFGGGLQSTHTIALQTLSAKALETSGRTNISTDVYATIQHELNERGVPSTVELIWPLPGETLDSFRDGIDQLCRMGAQGFFVHPLMWLNNVGFRGREDELGIELLDDEDRAGESLLVIRTREVDRADHLTGLHFVAATQFLYSARGLHLTLRILDALGLARHRDVLDAFIVWMQARRGDPISDMWNDNGPRVERLVVPDWVGLFASVILHEHRGEFDRLLADFVNDHIDGWCADESDATRTLVRAAAEFDLLLRPVIYVTTKTDIRVPLAYLQIERHRRGVWRARSPFNFPAILQTLRAGNTLTDDDTLPGEYEIEVNHRERASMPPPTWTEADYRWNALTAIHEMAGLEPRLSVREIEPGEPAPGRNAGA